METIIRNQTVLTPLRLVTSAQANFTPVGCNVEHRLNPPDGWQFVLDIGAAKQGTLVVARFLLLKPCRIMTLEPGVSNRPIKIPPLE